MSVPILQRSNSGVHMEQFRAMLERTDLVRWRGLFAFATLDGLVLLEEEPDRSLRTFLDRGGEIDWVVGIDAVTTAGALTWLHALASEYVNSVTARVYKSQSGEFLFHPKLSIFEFTDGSGAVLVGSSNLTTGGQTRNVELSAWLELDAAGIAPWLRVHDDIASSQPQAVSISNIEIVEVAERRRTERRAARAAAATVRVIEAEPEITVEERVLIRIVPRAGDRLEQVGIPADRVLDFFHLTPEHGDRTVRLQRVEPDGRVGRVEVRPLVRSEINRNWRIEIEGLRDIAYPEEGRPLLVFVQVEEDFFRYFIRLPGDPGHEELEQFAESVPGTGRGFPAVIAARDALLDVWTDFPE